MEPTTTRQPNIFERLDITEELVDNDHNHNHPRHQLIRTIGEPHIWFSGRGQRIRVESMTIKHIKSCLAWCIRKQSRLNYIPKFEEEIALREPLLHIRVHHDNPPIVNDLAATATNINTAVTGHFHGANITDPVQPNNIVYFDTVNDLI